MTIKVRSSSQRSSSRQSTSPAIKAGFLTTVLFGERKGSKAIGRESLLSISPRRVSFDSPIGRFSTALERK
jgi:hypothetical protein